MTTAAGEFLDLPHDFVVEEPFDENANGDQGYRPKNVGWYRSSFTCPRATAAVTSSSSSTESPHIATVWFNGNVVRHNWSGYDSAYIDLAPFARFGGEPNMIAVRVDSSRSRAGGTKAAGFIGTHGWSSARRCI